MSEKLMPCPFCGGTAGDDDLPDSVYCTKCGAETPRYLWNTRTPAPEVRAAALEEAARECEERGRSYRDAKAPGWQDVDHETAQCAAAIRALASNDAVPRTLSEFVHAPQALKEKIGMEVVDAAIARQTLSSTTSPQPVREACRKEGWKLPQKIDESHVQATLFTYRSELDKNMSNSSGSPGHDAMRVALYKLRDLLAAAPASDGEGGGV